VIAAFGEFHVRRGDHLTNKDLEPGSQRVFVAAARWLRWPRPEHPYFFFGGNLPGLVPGVVDFFAGVFAAPGLALGAPPAFFAVDFDAVFFPN